MALNQIAFDFDSVPPVTKEPEALPVVNEIIPVLTKPALIQIEEEEIVDLTAIPAVAVQPKKNTQ